MKQEMCPVCKTEPVDSARETVLIDCQSCGLCWTLLRDDINAAELYEDEVYKVVDNRDSVFEKIIFREARAVLHKADRYLEGESRRLLDLGSGKGQFLIQAQRMGWDALGIETARDRADFARSKYGVEVLEELYISGAVSAEKFDLITLNHVLEHLPEPISLLRELLEHNLDAKGVLMIEVPRLNSWQSTIAGPDWMHLDLPKHLAHWRENQLVSELEKLGYETIGRRRFSVHLGLLGMLQALAARTGYKENIIVALKRKRTFGLLVRMAILLPVAFVLELAAVPFNRTGVMGLFLRWKVNPGVR